MSPRGRDTLPKNVDGSSEFLTQVLHSLSFGCGNVFICMYNGAMATRNSFHKKLSLPTWGGEGSWGHFLLSFTFCLYNSVSPTGKTNPEDNHPCCLGTAHRRASILPALRFISTLQQDHSSCSSNLVPSP